MSVVYVLARILCLAGPVAFAIWMVRRIDRAPDSVADFEPSRPRVLLALIPLVLGAAAFVPATLAEAWLKRWTGLDESPRGAELAMLVYAFFVAAPLEQGLKVAAFAPVFRARSRSSPRDGVLFAGAAALGFVTSHNAWFLFSTHPTGFGAALRALLAVPAHIFFAGVWGYALGRDPNRRLGGRAFNVAWVLATLFNGIFDNIAFERRLAALIATAPILGCIALVTWLGARPLLVVDGPAQSRPSIARRFLPAIAPPSLEAVRAALRRSERPVMLRWIGIGALVTTGLLTTALTLAVMLGHKLGVDFAAVDRGDVSAAGTTPLVLLGTAALGAFPVGGYLVARASGARSVLEPAIGAALAIAGVLVLLGLAAPVAVVFAIAFAPVAFALACAGAWMGMSR